MRCGTTVLRCYGIGEGTARLLRRYRAVSGVISTITSEHGTAHRFTPGGARARETGLREDEHFEEEGSDDQQDPDVSERNLRGGLRLAWLCGATYLRVEIVLWR